MKKVAFILCLFSAFSMLSRAQGLPSLPGSSLAGKMSIAVNLGLLNETSTTVSNLNSSSNAKFAGSLGLNYWLSNEWAIELQAGLLSAETNANVNIAGIEQSAAAVTPILAGVRFYPSDYLLGRIARPYIMVLVGSYIGSYANDVITFNSKTGSVSATEGVFGSKMGVGIDVFIPTWVRLGLNVDYNLVSDYSNPVGIRKNYSGAEFSLTFGVYF